MSNTSSIRLNATGSDPDGTVVAVQYYVDGIPYGEEIPRRPGGIRDSIITNLSSENLEFEVFRNRQRYEQQLCCLRYL